MAYFQQPNHYDYHQNNNVTYHNIMNKTAPNLLDVWDKLKSHQIIMAEQRIDSLFQQEAKRYKNFSLTAANLTLDYSKNLLDETGLQLLIELAEKSQLGNAIQSLFNGENINTSEQRPALHSVTKVMDYQHPFNRK